MAVGGGGSTSLAQRFTAIVRVLKTTKTTWLDGLERLLERFADRAEPAKNYS